MVAQFRKRPVVIEALQWLPDDPIDVSYMAGWLVTHRALPDLSVLTSMKGRTFRIKTLEGDMEVSPGDYVIRGVAGEFYPCKPEIFAATYEPVVAKDVAKRPPGPPPFGSHTAHLKG